MLVGIEGGGKKRDGAQKIAAVFEAYAFFRSEEVDAEESMMVEIALEMIAAFFRAENADLIPGAERSRRPATTGASLVTVLDAHVLIRGLSSCVRLFSYYCVVSAALIALFRREARALAHWVRGEGIGSEADLRQFERSWRDAQAAAEQHQRLQEILEIFSSFGVPSELGAAEGRFLITAVKGNRAKLVVPEAKAVYQVRVPADALSYFRPGTQLSSFIERRAYGWVPVAASLPVEAAVLERLRRCVQASSRWSGPR